MKPPLEYRGQLVADDEWCPICGESLPCSCDDYDDGDIGEALTTSGEHLG